jgi:RNA polymerase sigma-70 factor, ECF subfamily
MTEGELKTRFERLYDGTAHARAWGYARRLVLEDGGSAADAEDLLQEALALAWRALPSLRDEGAFVGWLLAIVRRRYLTRRPRLRRERGQLVDVPELPAGEGDPRAQAALEALHRLPAGPRELLSLFYLHGLTAEETARALGLAPRAVRMRLLRARRLLRDALETDIPHAGPTARRTT